MAVRAAQGHLDLPEEIRQQLRAQTDLYVAALVNRYRWQGDPAGVLPRLIRPRNIETLAGDLHNRIQQLESLHTQPSGAHHSDDSRATSPARLKPNQAQSSHEIIFLRPPETGQIGQQTVKS